MRQCSGMSLDEFADCAAGLGCAPLALADADLLLLPLSGILERRDAHCSAVFSASSKVEDRPATQGAEAIDWLRALRGVASPRATEP
jgi:hypothetical protein